MKIDPKASAATSFFMVLTVIMLAALAWSVNQDEKNTADETPAASIQTPE